MWKCAEYIPLLCAAVLVATITVSFARRWHNLAWVFLAGAVAASLLSPKKRAERCETARMALQAAIARYQGDPDLRDSALSEADERAHEALRVERIRFAPPWIRRRRRLCWIKALGWLSPAILAFAAIPFEQQWMRSWHIVPVVAVFILLLAAGAFKAGKPLEAALIFSQAVERYEYESAATESELFLEDRRASEALQRR
jgi:hypothetical protein